MFISQLKKATFKWMNNGALLEVDCGKWLLTFLNPSQRWCWCWNEYGYDCYYRIWCFGIFLEVMRVDDSLMKLNDEMMNIKDLFMELDGAEFSAQDLECAVLDLRKKYADKISAEYNVERIIQYADRAGWFVRSSDKPMTVTIRIS